MLRFADPLALLALPIVAAVVILLRRRERYATILYSDLRLVLPRKPSSRLRTKWFPTALRLAALLMLILAIARPQLGRGLRSIRGEGIDIVAALDISGSMAAPDFEPLNRLGAAKRVMSGFISQREYDRIGLVLFARNAFSYSPLTLDHQRLLFMLSQTDLAEDLGLEDGTAIGLGIAQAALMLKGSDAKSRVIIVLTDGVNNAGQIDPLTAAQAAKALGITVYTVGAARSGQALTTIDDAEFGSPTRAADGTIDEETLQKVAAETGGRYFRATDADGLRQVYDEIGRLEKSDVEVQVFTEYGELAGYLLLPAMAILLLETLLRTTVFRSLP